MSDQITTFAASAWLLLAAAPGLAVDVNTKAVDSFAPQRLAAAEGARRSEEANGTTTRTNSSPAGEVAALGARALAADYAADIPEMHEIAHALEPFVADEQVGAWARYWRGFSYWRSAINLFNVDATNPRALTDLTSAEAEFGAAMVDPAVAADAKSARASCILNFAYLASEKEDRGAALKEYLRLIGEAKAAQPDNPRVHWVNDWGLYYAPPPQGGADAAIAALTAALEASRRDAAAPHPPAAPTWGEPELLMALSWIQENRPDPKLLEADRRAHEALSRVPEWHYVKAILLPQIHAKMAGGATPIACPSASGKETSTEPH
ncbi:MAG TPA: hypothetical protein VGS22_06885 [Thermoanaerobaculia bacterium]|jgi:hypothetical protein|nr:hypothetical protein [Thermoanaerobaculia bacterium]